jgi:hypothetical protein
MKTLFILSLLWIVAPCKSPAQTNDISPKLRKEMKEMDDRVQFMRTNECPIQAHIIVRDGETSCDVACRGHTNMVTYEPIPEQQFDFHLFSEDGKEISKKSNYKFGQSLNPDKQLLTGNYLIQDDVIHVHIRQTDFKNGNYSHTWSFDILKSFRIKKPGEYRLQVEMRLFTKDTNGVFQPFILPPVETKVNISESDLGKSPFQSGRSPAWR